AIPIEKAKGSVASLLNLRYQDAAADRVDRSGRQVHTIARTRLELVQAINDRSMFQSVAEPGFADAGQETAGNTAARSSVEHVPRFRLAPFTGAEPLHRVVIGMNLDRYPIVAIQELHEPRKRRILRCRAAEKCRPVVLHQFAQRAASVASLHHAAAMHWMIA